MKSDDRYGFSKKWSPEIEQYGFTQTPNILLACEGHLGLKDGEVVVLLQLIMHWFRHNGQVYPSIASLAGYSNKGYSTVQKTLSSLEKKGFIKRRRRNGTSSIYDIKYCAIKLHEHQNVCPTPLHRRSKVKVKIEHSLASNTTNKEYEPKRRNIKKTKAPLGEIVKSQYLDGYVERVWRM